MCKATVTSVEEYDLSQTHRVQWPDGSLAPFLRDRLFLDVYQSLSHRKSALGDATALTDTIIQVCIATSHRGKINNSTIIDLVSSTLDKFDTAGAIYYRSHHPIN
jgi:transcriptional regulator NrdR family protein